MRSDLGQMGLYLAPRLATVVAPEPFTGVLDDLDDDPLAAHSITRRLTGEDWGEHDSISNPLIRLREDNTNTERNFTYNVSNVLNTVAIEAWRTDLGATNLYGVRIFNQKGVSDTTDWTQSSASEQPVYTASGINSLPGFSFDGTVHTLRADGIADALDGDDQPLSILSVMRHDVVNASDVFIGLSSGDSANPLYIVRVGAAVPPNLNIVKRDTAGNIVALSTGVAGGIQRRVHLVTHTGTASSWWRNNVLLLDSEAQNVNNMAFGVPQCTMMSSNLNGTKSNHAQGFMPETYFWNSVVGEQTRLAVSNDAGDFYGITIA